MKKFIISGLLVILTSLTMSANNNIGLFNVGARIGIVSSSEVVPTTGAGLEEAIKAEGTGWTGTLFARINVPILPIFIQPELQYTNTTIEIPLVLDNSTTTAKHTYIDLPVMVGAELGLGELVRVRVNAGPVFAIASDKAIGDLSGDDFTAAYNDPKMSWTAGLGVTILAFTADLRYNGNFVDNKIDMENIMGSINTDRASWSLSIGLMF